MWRIARQRLKVRFKRGSLYPGRNSNEMELFPGSKFTISGNSAYPGSLKWGFCVPTKWAVLLSPSLSLYIYSRLLLIKPPRNEPFLELISHVSYCPTGLFSKKSKLASKSGSNKWWGLLTGELLTEVYCTSTPN